jgi:predicted RNA methylase
MKARDQGAATPVQISLSPPDDVAVSAIDTYAVIGSLLKNVVYRQVTAEELELLALWEAARPESLRAFDQIPMQGSDLLCQVKLVAPFLAGKRVAFVGDHDGTSLLLGLLSSHGMLKGPAQMTLLDFDDRLLEAARELADEHAFSDRFVGRLYNVFDPLPKELVGVFDAFYVNPPYGASNQGASARLFITRGCELTDNGKASGYVLLPVDQERQWTRSAMLATQNFLINYGWRITAHFPQMHRYHLNDDVSLMSSLVCLEYEDIIMPAPPMPWQGRAVSHREIPHFYGRGVLPPFPKYIATDGQEITPLELSQEDEQL